MKNILLFLVLSITFLFKVNAQTWATAGPNDFNQLSVSNASYTSLVFDSSGTPYVAFADRNKDDKVTVKKYDGNSWQIVGIDGFSVADVHYVSLAISSNGTLFVAYLDTGINYDSKVYVKTFDGTSWQTVGAAGGIANDDANYISLAIDASGVPYVAYTTYGNNNGGKVKVKKYDGNSWVDTGTISTGESHYTSMAFNASGDLYITYSDWGLARKAVLKKYDGNSWQNVGGSTFSTGQADYLSLAISPAGAVFVGYTDSLVDDKATMKKYVLGSWEDVGTEGISPGAASYTSVAVDLSGIPYIAYSDLTDLGKLIVRKFSGNSWLTSGTVASGGCGGYDCYYESSLAIDPSNIPYIVFPDIKSGSKATLKKSDGNFWPNVGGSISAGAVTHVSGRVRNGTAYTAYVNSTSGKTEVVVYSGSSWQIVSKETNSKNNFIQNLNKTYNQAVIKLDASPGETDYSSLAIDKNSGEPYIAYSDGENSFKVVVRKHDGNSWQSIGTEGFSVGEASYNSLEIDLNGTPYIAYSDEGNGNKLTIKKYDGSSWQTVGTEGLSVGESRYNSLAIDSNGTPYIAYSDEGLSGKLSLKKFDGNTWQIIGTEGFTSGRAKYNSLVINGNDIPVLAFTDEFLSNKAIVVKYDGTLQLVGAFGFSPGEANYISLAIDASDTPYVAYQDGANNNKATVKKFDGSEWQTVETEGISASEVKYTSLAIDSSSELFLVYDSDGLFAKTYNSTLGINGFNNKIFNVKLYPNPTSNNFKIDIGNNSNIEALEIYDILGKKVMSVKNNIDHVNISSLNNGIYILKIKTNNGEASKKLIVSK